MNYNNYLVLYSGGADSTYFISREESAKHLLHYKGLNQAKTKIAVSNAFGRNKYITIVEEYMRNRPPDGEVNEFHALIDTQMALNASITALSFGMKGIVLGFNQDALGIDRESLEAIVHRVQPDFEILTPLSDMSAEEIRRDLQNEGIPYVSCMVSRECGECPKCERGY